MISRSRIWRPRPLLRALTLGTVALALVCTAGANAADRAQLERAHYAILRLDLNEAHDLLKPIPDSDREGALQRALLALYEGDCDGAATLLNRPSFSFAQNEYAASLTEVANGCARVTAATVTVRDDARGVVVRLKDDQDAPWVPFLIDVAEKGRATLERELGVQLPRPLRIEVVRDHYSLAAMTGLPEQAAQTTGTVAVAKWGRVIMLTPRAAPHGYPWADTLMHEMTHLAVTRATMDHAPLWLQEGIAKREETRWRAPWIFDTMPSADAMSKLGFDRGLGLPLDKLGPSIAMLPSAEQAMVAFAEVTSFVRFWVEQVEQGKQNEQNALPRLLTTMDDSSIANDVDAALTLVSGADLHQWNSRWQTYLTTVSANIPPDLSPKGSSGPPEPTHNLARQARLASLLADRDHPSEALSYAKRAVDLASTDPTLRAQIARILRTLGRSQDASHWVDTLEAVHSVNGLFLALYGDTLRAHGAKSAQDAFTQALWLDPLDPDVACELLPPSEHPSDPVRAQLCDGARKGNLRH